MARESSGESRQAEAISCPKASSVLTSFAPFMAWYSLLPNKKIVSQDSVITRPLHSCHCSADSGAHLGQGKCCFMQPHFDSRSSLLKSVHTEICVQYIIIFIYIYMNVYIDSRYKYLDKVSIYLDFPKRQCGGVATLDLVDCNPLWFPPVGDDSSPSWPGKEGCQGCCANHWVQVDSKEIYNLSVGWQHHWIGKLK